MNFRPIIFKILMPLIITINFISPVSAMDDPGFTINRMIMCERVLDREPINESVTFSADTESVYCFLEAKDIETDTPISFIWYFEGEEKARVTLPLQKGMRWRTYSSKKLANMKGRWTVELQEVSGIVLNTVSFQVQ